MGAESIEHDAIDFPYATYSIVKLKKQVGIYTYMRTRKTLHNVHPMRWASS
jgi:hypothetical protein